MMIGCTNCSYHEGFRQDLVDGVCPNCGGTLVEVLDEIQIPWDEDDGEVRILLSTWDRRKLGCESLNAKV